MLRFDVVDGGGECDSPTSPIDRFGLFGFDVMDGRGESHSPTSPIDRFGLFGFDVMDGRGESHSPTSPIDRFGLLRFDVMDGGGECDSPLRGSIDSDCLDLMSWMVGANAIRPYGDRSVLLDLADSVMGGLGYDLISIFGV